MLSIHQACTAYRAGEAFVSFSSGGHLLAFVSQTVWLGTLVTGSGFPKEASQLPSGGGPFTRLLCTLQFMFLHASHLQTQLCFSYKESAILNQELGRLCAATWSCRSTRTTGLTESVPKAPQRHRTPNSEGCNVVPNDNACHAFVTGQVALQ